MALVEVKVPDIGDFKEVDVSEVLVNGLEAILGASDVVLHL